MRTLILHIGAAKSGSSAIQRFLVANRAALRSRGVLVPSRELDLEEGLMTGEQVFFFEGLLQKGVLEAQWTVNRKMEALLASVPADQRRHIVVSAENLCNHAQFAAMWAGQRKRFRVRVVFYVRRQDDFFISAWQQWHLKHAADFGSWLLSEKGRMGDWAGQLLPWEELYGSENIVVRRFSRERLIQGDVVRDFLACAGLPEGPYSLEGPEINRSHDEAVAYLAHGARDLFESPHDDRPYLMFDEWVGQRAFRRDRRSSLMSLDTRLDLLEAYREGNERLRKVYFPDEEGPLFPAPTPDDVAGLSREEILQEQVAMLTRVLFGMHRELAELRKRLADV